MRQCPVCKSETGDEPVCPVCGFDISCDYGRFPTLGAGIPRDLKARALQRVKDAKDDAGEAEGPTGAPEQTADEPPVSLLSQKEADTQIANRNMYATFFAIASFFGSFLVYICPVYGPMNLFTSLMNKVLVIAEDRGTSLLILILCGVILIIQLRWSLKKMKPDEWVWRKQNDGKWIVLEKDDPGNGREKKMVTAFLLLCFGWMFGLDIMYLDGFSNGKWKLVIRYLISCVGIVLFLRIANTSYALEDRTIIALGVPFIVCFIFAYMLPLERILRLPPVFEKGEY